MPPYRYIRNSTGYQFHLNPMPPRRREKASRLGIGREKKDVDDDEK
jgi:hypothetical protein